MSDDSVPDRDPMLALFIGLAFSLGLDTAEIAELASGVDDRVTEAEVVRLLEKCKKLTEGEIS